MEYQERDLKKAISKRNQLYNELNEIDQNLEALAYSKLNIFYKKFNEYVGTVAKFDSVGCTISYNLLNDNKIIGADGSILQDTNIRFYSWKRRAPILTIKWQYNGLYCSCEIFLENGGHCYTNSGDNNHQLFNPSHYYYNLCILLDIAAQNVETIKSKLSLYISNYKFLL